MLEISQIRIAHSSPSSLGILFGFPLFFQVNTVMVTDSNSGFPILYSYGNFKFDAIYHTGLRRQCIHGY